MGIVRLQTLRTVVRRSTGQSGVFVDKACRNWYIAAIQPRKMPTSRIGARNGSKIGPGGTISPCFRRRSRIASGRLFASLLVGGTRVRTRVCQSFYIGINCPYQRPLPVLPPQISGTFWGQPCDLGEIRVTVVADPSRHENSASALSRSRPLPQSRRQRSRRR